MEPVSPLSSSSSLASLQNSVTQNPSLQPVNSASNLSSTTLAIIIVVVVVVVLAGVTVGVLFATGVLPGSSSSSAITPTATPTATPIDPASLEFKESYTLNKPSANFQVLFWEEDWEFEGDVTGFGVGAEYDPTAFQATLYSLSRVDGQITVGSSFQTITNFLDHQAVATSRTLSANYYFALTFNSVRPVALFQVNNLGVITSVALPSADNPPQVQNCWFSRFNNTLYLFLFEHPTYTVFSEGSTAGVFTRDDLSFTGVSTTTQTALGGSTSPWLVQSFNTYRLETNGSVDQFNPKGTLPFPPEATLFGRGAAVLPNLLVLPSSGADAGFYLNLYQENDDSGLQTLTQTFAVEASAGETANIVNSLALDYDANMVAVNYKVGNDHDEHKTVLIFIDFTLGQVQGSQVLDGVVKGMKVSEGFTVSTRPILYRNRDNTGYVYIRNTSDSETKVYEWLF